MAETTNPNWFNTSASVGGLNVTNPSSYLSSGTTPATTSSSSWFNTNNLLSNPTANEGFNITNANNTPDVLDGIDPKTGSDSWNWGGISQGVNAVAGLGQAMAAWGQYQNAEDTLAQNKAEYNRNLANQASTINASVADQYQSRLSVSSDKEAFLAKYGSEDSYVADRGVDGSAV